MNKISIINQLESFVKRESTPTSWCFGLSSDEETARIIYTRLDNYGAVSSPLETLSGGFFYFFANKDQFLSSLRAILDFEDRDESLAEKLIDRISEEDFLTNMNHWVDNTEYNYESN